MLYSLLIKLGMFAVTFGIVLWIGWSLPASFDRTHDPDAQSPEHPPAAIASSGEAAAVVRPAPLAALPEETVVKTVPGRAPSGSLDVNRATKQDFDALPGIGPKLAERIVEYRQSVGAFHSLDELRSVKGIGKKKLERIRHLVTVTPDTSAIAKGKKTT